MLTNVTKRYPMGDVTVHALRGVSLAVDAGDFVANDGLHEAVQALPARDLLERLPHDVRQVIEHELELIEASSSDASGQRSSSRRG